MHLVPPFHKGDNFVTSCSRSCIKRGYFKRKEFIPKGANAFLLELTYFHKRQKTERVTMSLLRNLLITLKLLI